MPGIFQRASATFCILIRSFNIALLVPVSEATRFLCFFKVAPRYRSLTTDSGRLLPISSMCFFFQNRNAARSDISAGA